MRSLALTLLGLSCALLVGCGGGDESGAGGGGSGAKGEPMQGTLSGTFKGKTFDARFGVATKSASDASLTVLTMGEGAVDCDDTSTLPDGSYVIVNLRKGGTGSFTSPDADVSVLSITSLSYDLDTGAQPSVTIDGIGGGRVSGSLEMSDGSYASAKGTFDVKTCF